MDITVTFRHMDPIESVRDYAEEKISKIDKYLDTVSDAHIVLSIEKFRHTADVTLTMNGARIKGVEETEDMYSAIDQVMDKIEKQVKKYLSKSRTRRSSDSIKEGGMPEEALAEAEEEADEEESMRPDEGPAIEVEKRVAMPMDPEEAAMQLSMSQRSVYVFRNPRSKEINVLYKRSDGRLGLIEPSN
ncbi:MAG: ribosome-associated translation inhibitor RaiA [Deltaproteobacteria bacterium]|nr:ribosome-associated translation inhibitor RaiA [Deltaproteobacteria bacterium]